MYSANVVWSLSDLGTAVWYCACSSRYEEKWCFKRKRVFAFGYCWLRRGVGCWQLLEDRIFQKGASRWVPKKKNPLNYDKNPQSFPTYCLTFLRYTYTNHIQIHDPSLVTVYVVSSYCIHVNSILQRKYWNWAKLFYSKVKSTKIIGEQVTYQKQLFTATW